MMMRRNTRRKLDIHRPFQGRKMYIFVWFPGKKVQGLNKRSNTKKKKTPPKCRFNKNEPSLLVSNNSWLIQSIASEAHQPSVRPKLQVIS